MPTTTLTGLQRIEAAFAAAAGRRQAALMPYLTLGYPDRETSLAAVEAIAPYSDLMELGVPFSDPIADGPTIQRSTQRALEAGTTVRGCLDMVSTMRARGVTTPALLMGYTNPIMAYGVAAYARDARAAGADGFIVPDLPPEESAEIAAAARENGLVLVHFLAPTSNPARIADVARRAEGFIYMVSVTGVTGARAAIRHGLDAFVTRVRAQAQVPVAVGFGISTPEQAAAVGRFADGVIVGSAVINALDAGGVDGCAAFVRALHAGLQPPE